MGTRTTAPAPTLSQRQFWAGLVEARFATYYLHAYHAKYDSCQTTLAIFLAIASSASIAAWAVWREAPFIWATIIAASQVVAAVKPFLPWERRLKSVVAAKREYEALFLFAETQWYSVANGFLTDREIHHAVIEIKKQRARIEESHFDTAPLPEDEAHQHRARTKTEKYFSDYEGS